ncbi:hypothetical protein LWC34_50565 [Kibdelosporangium philippinense]|uniref:Uncharacterized protein n=1 Tax=Kibdelosporangium philippinense TaxID=211113 RepID=A0ABS8ZTI2_9PSEU|nr:hypothetical protein [Kibdelosporangium philippinense]MCE7010997.1 hypothetical protein [Kibdelosporangium philippinense]
MIPDRLVHEGLQVLAEMLQGFQARRLPSGGVFASPKLGGPEALATLFPPVSADPQIVADFRARHEAGMRGEVYAAVMRTLERWGHECGPGCDQTHFDDLFVSLTNLRFMLRPRKDGAARVHDLAEQLAMRATHYLDALTETWFQPLIRAKLNGETSQ